MEEIWKDIEGTNSKFKVSNLGRFKGKRGIMKGRVHPNNGYVYVDITKDDVKKERRAHRLVAQTFIPNPDNLPYVNHKNAILTDNRVENLEWCTAQYNTDYSVSKQVGQYTLDGEFVEKYKSASEAHRKTGITTSSILRVCKGEEGRKQAGGFIWKFTR